MHWVFLCRAAFGHVVSAYRHTMIQGVSAVVKWVFSSGFATRPHVMSRTHPRHSRNAPSDLAGAGCPHEYVVGRRTGGMGERKDARTQ